MIMHVYSVTLSSYIIILYHIVISRHDVCTDACLPSFRGTSTAQGINLLLHLLNAALLAVHLLLQGVQPSLGICVQLSQLGALAHGHSELGRQHAALCKEEESLARCIVSASCQHRVVDSS